MASEERNDSPPSPPPPPPPPPPAYRTKTVQFLGRSTPIILQNDNGPCPLLAICNVLLLRNSLNPGPDTPEVPLQRLLSLVAEKLIDSNSQIQDKDDEYVINQQQNIADAIDLLPRLATGIDVNVQFRKINDFEFTRECAIFDLLDIGLYHGWILDPQDTDSAAAIGSKSYNALVGELVSFDTVKSKGEDNGTVVEDYVDFAAATTAALGVPSPCLSRGRSFDDCPGPVPAGEGSRKGDKEEEEELMRALNMSKADISSPVHVSVSPDTNSSLIIEGNKHTESSESENHTDAFVEQITDKSEKSEQPNSYASQRCNTSSDFKDDDPRSQFPSTENDTLPSNTFTLNKMDQTVSEGSGDFVTSSDLMGSMKIDFLMPNPAPPFQSTSDGSDGCYTREGMTCQREDHYVSQTCTEDLFTSEILQRPVENLTGCDSAVSSDPVSLCTDLQSSNVIKELPDVSVVDSSSLDESEPIYEGEECILESAYSKFEGQEPVYEGEAALAEQADNMEDDTAGSNSNNRVTQQQCQLIKNFLERSASQLTIYGLFCLQEGLKERELCVFFRNNHFSTMFKFNGELYLLATDQGYISQPDLVWEKLNEVNGDTVFMTGNFTEFRVENQVSDSWNEQNAIDSTADYLAKFGSSEPSSSLNSDYELAISLQQKEFEQQPQRPQQQSTQQSQVNGRSRLITGPQVSRSSHAPQRNESKSKDKCTVM